MKKLLLIAFILASLFLFLSASVWEGTASITDELPSSGLYIATNSFPINTVVDVENLENGKIISLLVASRLEVPGFLAMLSRDAGNAIDIPGNSIGRIRMSESDDSRAFSHYVGARVALPAQEVTLPVPIITEENLFEIVTFEETIPIERIPEDYRVTDEGRFYDNIRMESGELIVDLPEELSPQPPPALIVQAIPEFDSLTLVPSEARPPVTVSSAPNPEFFIPQIENRETQTVAQTQTVPQPVPQPAPQTVVQQPPPPPAITQRPASFPVPTINRLEEGMYYLQIGAYSQPDSVHAEISSLDNNLPVVIMNAGTANEPVYRVLIGPLNLGESGAMMHRFRNTHRDAFIRQGT